MYTLIIHTSDIHTSHTCVTYIQTYVKFAFTFALRYIVLHYGSHTCNTYVHTLHTHIALHTHIHTIHCSYTTVRYNYIYYMKSYRHYIHTYMHTCMHT